VDAARAEAVAARALLEPFRGTAYAPTAGSGRAPRAESLLHLDHSIAVSARTVIAAARAALALAPALGAPALAASPFLPLLDGSVDALLRVSEDVARR
jgi:hypothetical protein